jgi:hypothetical protein
METADHIGGKTLITELNPAPEINFGGNDGDESDQEEKYNAKIFNVNEAIPPTDYEAPYSEMPTNVKLEIVKAKVKNSYKMVQQRAKELADKM